MGIKRRLANILHREQIGRDSRVIVDWSPKETSAPMRRRSIHVEWHWEGVLRTTTHIGAHAMRLWVSGFGVVGVGVGKGEQ